MLFCSDSEIAYFFTLSRNPKIYFSEKILEMIEKALIKYIGEENLDNNKLSQNGENSIMDYSSNLINRIINILYEEYIQINI